MGKGKKTPSGTPKKTPLQAAKKGNVAKMHTKPDSKQSERQASFATSNEDNVEKKVNVKPRPQSTTKEGSTTKLAVSQATAMSTSEGSGSTSNSDGKSLKSEKKSPSERKITTVCIKPGVDLHEELLNSDPEYGSDLSDDEFVINPIKKKEPVGDKADGERPNEDVVEEEEETASPREWTYEYEITQIIKMLVECPGYMSEDDKAMRVYVFLDEIVSSEIWKTTRELVDITMNIDLEVATKAPSETTPRNIVYRFRKFIFDEYDLALNECGLIRVDTVSCEAFFAEATSVTEQKYGVLRTDLKDEEELMVGERVRKGVKAAAVEYKTELENMTELIAAYGPKIINEDEIVLSYGTCPTTAALLSAASKKHDFRLYILDTEPLNLGFMMADELEEAGCTVTPTMVEDENVATIVRHADKIILPVISIHQDGSFRAFAMAQVIMNLAKFYNKTVYCVGAHYQMTPGGVKVKNKMHDPHFLIDPNVKNKGNIQAHVFDFVEADENVVSYVTNQAVVQPQVINRLLVELYGPKDLDEGSLPTVESVLGGSL